MVSTSSQHGFISKGELIQQLADINSCFVNYINTKCSPLEKCNEFFQSVCNERM